MQNASPKQAGLLDSLKSALPTKARASCNYDFQERGRRRQRADVTLKPAERCEKFAVPHLGWALLAEEIPRGPSWPAGPACLSWPPSFSARSAVNNPMVR